MNSNLEGKLQDPAYRAAFVASQINIGIPFQIKALMKARGWTQEKLAERTGMLQPRISAILTPGKVRPNIETLRRFAEGFDCGLLVRFAPFSELARWSDSFDPERFNVPAFEDDPVFKPKKEPEPEEVAVFAEQGQPMSPQGASANAVSSETYQYVRNIGTQMMSKAVEAVMGYAYQGGSGLAPQDFAEATRTYITDTSRASSPETPNEPQTRKVLPIESSPFFTLANVGTRKYPGFESASSTQTKQRAQQ